jgi:AcrR family transcriptional regulator
MDDVATASGVAKGTLYLYFPSKTELITELRREYGRELVEQAGGLLAPLAPGEPAAPRVLDLASAMFEFIIERRELHHILFHEAGASEDEQLEPIVEIVTRFLEMAMRNGQMRPGDPRFLATVIVAGLHAAMASAIHAAAPDRDEFDARAKDLVSRLFS